MSWHFDTDCLQALASFLFRLTGADPNADSERALTAIGARQDWAGHFSVVTELQIRMRPLPIDID